MVPGVQPTLAAAAYQRFGLNRGEHEGRRGIWYREWAPGAKVRLRAMARGQRRAGMPGPWSRDGATGGRR